jgi:hypothetical protein
MEYWNNGGSRRPPRPTPPRCPASGNWVCLAQWAPATASPAHPAGANWVCLSGEPRRDPAELGLFVQPARAGPRRQAAAGVPPNWVCLYNIRWPPSHPVQPGIGFVSHNRSPQEVPGPGCPRPFLVARGKLASFCAFRRVRPRPTTELGSFRIIAPAFLDPRAASGGEIGFVFDFTLHTSTFRKLASFCTIGIGLEWWNDRTVERWGISPVGNWVCFA